MLLAKLFSLHPPLNLPQLLTLPSLLDPRTPLRSMPSVSRSYSPSIVVVDSNDMDSAAPIVTVESSNPKVLRCEYAVCGEIVNHAQAFYGFVALIYGNGYIVGINQIYDIGIDKVNKPYLPIAARDLSVQSARIVVASFVATGLIIVAWNFGPFITCLYCLGLFLGTIYLVPLFRLKRYPVPIFLIITMLFGLCTSKHDYQQGS